VQHGGKLASTEESQPVNLFVLTRLAEHLPGKKGNLRDDDWIENQCQFVERYSAPSLAQQTDRDFQWLVSISEKLSANRRKRILRAIGPRGKLIFQQGDEHSAETFGRYLSQFSGHYLTVRFDSDDVLHSTFVEKAKLNFDLISEVFSFVSGIAYDVEEEIGGLWPHISNTFLFHRGLGGTNVYGLGIHTRVEAEFGKSLKVIWTPHPMWMKVIHRSNGWGDKITHADKPLFGRFVQRHFHSGKFATPFRPRRDFHRVLGYYTIWSTRVAHKFLGR
jgi:hypothetical protein